MSIFVIILVYASEFIPERYNTLFENLKKFVIPFIKEIKKIHSIVIDNLIDKIKNDLCE